METCQMHDSLIKRIEQCESKISNLESNDSDLNARQVRVETKIDYLTDEIKKLSDKIDKILEKPSKRWDTVINTIIVAIASGAVAFLFAKGGH